MGFGFIEKTIEMFLLLYFNTKTFCLWFLLLPDIAALGVRILASYPPKSDQENSDEYDRAEYKNCKHYNCKHVWFSSPSMSLEKYQTAVAKDQWRILWCIVSFTCEHSRLVGSIFDKCPEKMPNWRPWNEYMVLNVFIELPSWLKA